MSSEDYIRYKIEYYLRNKDDEIKELSSVKPGLTSLIERLLLLLDKIPILGSVFENIENILDYKRYEEIDFNSFMMKDVDTFLSEVCSLLLERDMSDNERAQYNLYFEQGLSRGGIIYSLCRYRECRIKLAGIKNIHKYRGEYWQYRLKMLISRVPILGRIISSVNKKENKG